MKKYLFLLFSLVTICYEGYSQSLTTDPPAFTPDDEVTFTIDVTGSTLEDKTVDVYAWVWRLAPGGGDAPTNVNPATPAQEAAKMTRSSENPNIYTIQFVPKDFIGVASTELTRMGIIAKGPSWTDGQTPNFEIDLLPPVFSSPVVRIFPTQFTAQDIVTVFYDSNLEEDPAMQEAGEYYLHTTIEGLDVNGVPLDPANYLLPIDAKTKLISMENGVYRITFIPDTFFTLNEGDVITKLLYRVQNADGSLTNPPAGFDVINTVVRKGVE